MSNAKNRAARRQAHAATPPQPVGDAANAPIAGLTGASAAAIAARDVESQPVAAAIQHTIEQGTKTMNDMNQTFQAEAGQATDRVQAMFGDMNDRSKAAVEKSTKMIEEATELTKGNVEAIVASSKIAAKGVESMGQDAADYGRKSFEEASAMLRKMAEVKSPTELFKLQSDYARSAFDAMVAESSKMSEAMLKLAGEVAEPLTSRYAVAAERAKSLAA